MKKLLLCLGTIICLNGALLAQDKKQAIDKIRKSGGLALEIAQNDPRLVVSFLSMDGEINADLLNQVKALENVAELNLRGRAVTDDMLAIIKDLKGLTRLHLEKTKVTDKGLPHLKGLANLEYLNLYGTTVSDKGIESLTDLKKLKSLYLWQTKVTDAGVEKLKKALPKVNIVRGISLAKPVKEEPKRDPKKPAPKPKPKEKKKK